jgi:hypothetical protein
LIDVINPQRLGGTEPEDTEAFRALLDYMQNLTGFA